jgi:PAS domain S-box-containing protein
LDRRVQQVIAFLDQNLHGEISLEQMASVVNLSPSRFRHLFEEGTGQPPARYLRALRLRKARELLDTTFLSVKEIMLRVGMKNQSQFVRDFKKAYGLSPTAYRTRALGRKLAAGAEASAGREPDAPEEMSGGGPSELSEDIHLLQEITLAASSAQSVEATLEVALRLVCDEVGFDLGEAWLLQPDGLQLECGAAYVCEGRGLEAFREESLGVVLPPGAGLPGRALPSKRPLWVGDVSRDRNFVRRETARRLGIRAGIAAPLRAGNEALAVLCFYTTEAREPDQRLISLVGAVGSQVAHILQRKWSLLSSRQSQRRYESLVNNIDGIIWEADPQTWRHTFVSGQAERILGYPVEQWLYEPNFWVERLHPDDRDRAVAEYVNATLAERPRQFEYRMIAADGRAVWFRDSVTVIAETSGPTSLHGIMVDITERKRAEEELREAKRGLERQVEQRTAELSRANETLRDEAEQHRRTARALREKEDRLKLAFSAAKMVTWEWDARADLTEDSYTSGQNPDLPPAASMPTRRAFLDLVHPEDRESVRGAIERCLAEDADYDVEFRFAPPGEPERWVASKGRLYRDEAGEPSRLVGVTMDVTERRRAEGALRGQQEFLRAVIDTDPNLIFVKDRDGRYVLANKAVAEKYGVTPEALVGRTDADFSVNPEEVKKFVADDREVMASGRPKFILEEPVTFAGAGETRWFQTIKVPLLSPEGEPQVLGVGTDITERRRAEREVRRKAELQETLARVSARFVNPADFDEAVSASLADIGRLSGAGRSYLHQFRDDCKFIDNTHEWCAPGVTPEIENLQGIPVEAYPWWMSEMLRGEAIRVGDVSRLPPEASAERELLEAQGIKSLVVLPVRAGAELAGMIGFDNVETTGEWGEEDLRLLSVVAGILGGAIQRLRAESAVEKRERHLAAVVEAQRELLICKAPLECYEKILEPLGRAAGASRVYIFENLPAEGGRLVSGQRAEWCGAGVKSQKGNPAMQSLAWEEFYPAWGEALARGEALTEVAADYPEQVRGELLGRQGILSFLLLPLTVGGEFFGFIGFDDCAEMRPWEPAEIDLLRAAAQALSLALERLRAEEALRESERQLLQAQKMEAVGQLAGGVAHDFNNLLAAIIIQCDLLLRRVDAADPIHRRVEDIRRAAERSASLTQQLLAFSRKQVLQPRTFDLNETVRDMQSMLGRLIGEHIELRVDLDAEPCHINADPTQLQQVVMNLLVNSRDAIAGGGRITVSTRNVYLDESYARSHRPMPAGRYVALSIGDTGEGMDAETQKHIFEPFFTTKEAGRGTGLGLSTVYGIVKQSGGYVWVSSEVGRGTTFDIQFPYVGEERGRARPRESGEEPPGGAETVLLVEDEDIVRMLTRELLEMGGYTVLEAASGHAAIEVCERRAGAIDLLVSDVVMPGMSGRELADKLSERHPEMRVLFISGYTDDAIGHHGVLDEGVNFIQKPFTIEAFLTKVRQALDAPR